MYPIIGRKYISSVLTTYLDATLQGSGACLVLEGPAGAGKTRLLKEAALGGAERGLAVAYMRANATEEAAIIREMIIFLRHVTSGEVEFDGLEMEGLIHSDMNPFTLADRLAEMIEDAARTHPMLIILDDAQQTDGVSGVALQGLVRSLSSAPVLWLLARRLVPAQSLAQQAIGWLCDSAAVQMHLGPLDDEAVTALCAGVLGARPDSSVLNWAVRCGGNPWLLENLMSGLMEAGRVVIVDRTASVLGDCLPGNVLREVHGLMDAAPPEALNLLVRSRRGDPRFPVNDEATPVHETSAAPCAGRDEALRAELTQGCDEQPTLVHGAVGQALSGVASGGAAPGSAVTAFEERRPRGIGVGAFPTMPSRGRSEGLRLVATPPSSACDCEEMTVQVISALGGLAEVPQRLARALCLLAAAGRGVEAGRLASIVIRVGLDTAAEAQLVLRLVRSLQRAGLHGLSAEHLRRTLARPDVPEPDQADLKGLLAEAVEQARGVHTAGGTRGPDGSTYAASLTPGRRVEAVVTEAEEHAQQLVHRPCDAFEWQSWTWMIRALIASDQVEEASGVVAAVEQASERQIEPSPGPRWHGYRAELLMNLGRLGEARVAAETGLRRNDRSVPGDLVPTHAVLARISLHDRDMAAVSEHLRAAERLIAEAPVADGVRFGWALAQFHAACGRPGMAVRTLVNIDGKLAPDALLFAEAPTAAAMLVRLAGRAGMGVEAQHAADFARRASQSNPEVPSLAGGAEHARGLLHHDLDALRRAVEYYRLGRRPLAAGIALEDAAQESHDSRHRTQAIEFLGSALGLYDQCGARRDVARVQKKLRRLGVRNAAELGANRPTSGWESLTTAELRVVRAIVDGKTNKEAASTLFLSPHTVDSHLRRVFGKLGINTRVALTKYFLTHDAA